MLLWRKREKGEGKERLDQRGKKGTKRKFVKSSEPEANKTKTKTKIMGFQYKKKSHKRLRIRKKSF